MSQRNRAGLSRPATSIRIISGRWRGSRLPVLDKKGLRPTPDRVRETVFNWLALSIPGATVLDCFAGAGGLGFEAASREAKWTTLVEIDQELCQNLQQQCDRLAAESIETCQADVRSFLDKTDRVYDLVFIDPPYSQPELRTQILSRLIKRNLLSHGALVYLEWPSNQEMTLNHENLHWIKQKTAASVCYAIAQWGDTG